MTTGILKQDPNALKLFLNPHESLVLQIMIHCEKITCGIGKDFCHRCHS